MPIIQHLTNSSGGGGAAADALQPFGDGSCHAYYPLDNNNQELINGYNFNNTSGENYTSNAKVGGYAWAGSGSNWMLYDGAGVAAVTNYTINFWYRCSIQAQSNMRLVTLRADSYTMGWSNYNNSLGFYTSDNYGNSTSVTRRMQILDNVVNDGAWHMLTCTMTNTKSYLMYMDGSNTTGSGNTGDGRSFNSGSHFALCCYNASPSYNTQGDVDNLRIFNRVLSPTEIADLYSWENI